MIEDDVIEAINSGRSQICYKNLKLNHLQPEISNAGYHRIKESGILIDEVMHNPVSAVARFPPAESPESKIFFGFKPQTCSILSIIHLNACQHEFRAPGYLDFGESVYEIINTGMLLSFDHCLRYVWCWAVVCQIKPPP